MKGLRAAMLALPLFMALMPLAPAALADAQNASVTITDSGFVPPMVNVPVGGSVTWTNNGTVVHTATSKESATSTGQNLTPAGFDSGGLGVGQTFNLAFTLPGTYLYTSATECLNGNSAPAFNCQASIVVGAPAPTIVGQTAPAPSTPAVPAGVTILQSATVSITDAGFSPPNVAVTTGGTTATAGTVTFVNNGTSLHTAASGAVNMADPRNVPESFHTGGLVPGESKSFSFINPGVYQFNSATDCLNGNTSTTFNCGGDYTVTVVKGPVGGTTSAVAPPFSGPVIYFRDPNGFDPASLTINVGQTVTWMNLGHDVHSVVSDSAALPFDSGGLGAGSVFTATFNTPGTYTYHSSTEPINSGTQISGWQFTGTIVVQ